MYLYIVNCEIVKKFEWDFIKSLAFYVILCGTLWLIALD